jgi:hypothetical protein
MIDTHEKLPYLQRPRRLGYGWLALGVFLLWGALREIGWSAWLITYSFNGPDYVGSTLLLHAWLALAWKLFELVGWALMLSHLIVSITILGFSASALLCLAVYHVLISSDPYGPLSGILEAAGGFLYALLAGRMVVLNKVGGYSRSADVGAGEPPTRPDLLDVRAARPGAARPFYREHASFLLAIGTSFAHFIIPMEVTYLAFYVWHWGATATAMLERSAYLTAALINAIGIYIGASDIARRGVRPTFVIGIALNVAVAGLFAYLRFFRFFLQ